MRKTIGAVVLAVALLLTTTGWTWSSATYKAGSANVGGSSGGGGILRWNGYDFVPGTGHVAMTLGFGLWDKTDDPNGPSSKFIGHVSHNARITGPHPDIMLTATGTDPLPPTMRVSNGWKNASIEHYASGAFGQFPAGRTLCQSGFHWATHNNGGYRCGSLSADCSSNSASCAIVNSSGVAGAGDSGGPVWDYYGGGVVLVGWMTSAGGTYLSGTQSYAVGYFVPVWVLARHVWTSAQTWETADGSPEPFPTGRTTGCFVTRTGCQTIT